MIPSEIRKWVALVVLVLALILVGLTLSWCASRKSVRTAEAGQAIAEGRTTSAGEAISAIGELGQRADATDTEVKEAQDAVRQASPADRDRVFRHRVCVLQQRPGCDRLLGTGPIGPDDQNAPR